MFLSKICKYILFYQYKGVYRNVSLQTVDYSALLQDEDNLDPSPSEPLEIVLPKDQDGEL